MLAIVIGVILMTMAIPSFVNMVENNRLATKANEFIADLNVARMEAIKQGRNGYICRSTNGTSCASADDDWSVGWIVWIDADSDNTLDSGELVRSHEALTGVSFTGTDSGAGNIASMQYLPTGYRDISDGGGSTVTFALSTDNCTGNNARTITIIPMGRANVSPASCS